MDRAIVQQLLNPLLLNPLLLSPLLLTLLLACNTSNLYALSQGSPSTIIVLAYDAAPNPPYNMANHLLEKPGISIEVLTAVGKKLDIGIEFRSYPWKRCLENVRKNVVDGVIDASFKPKRLEIGSYPMDGLDVDYDKRNNTQTYSFYVLKDSLLAWDGKQLSHLNKSVVAVTLGYSIIEKLERLGIDKINTTSGAKQSLTLLVGRRVPVIVDFDTTIEKLIADNPDKFSNIIKLPVPLETVELYVCYPMVFLAIIRH